MDKKKISGIILLIFVALSVIVLIAKEMTKKHFNNRSKCSAKAGNSVKTAP